VATPLWKVGIDIGDLRATVLTGYQASILQHLAAGREERAGQAESPEFPDWYGQPADQYFMATRRPSSKKNFENTLINPG